VPKADFVLALACLACGVAIGSGITREEWWVRTLVALYAVTAGVLVAVAWQMR
jgi:hypothetical protein